MLPMVQEVARKTDSEEPAHRVDSYTNPPVEVIERSGCARVFIDAPHGFVFERLLSSICPE